MTEELSDNWKKVVEAEMLEDLMNSPRHQVELIPYFINIIGNTETFAEAIARVNDAYLDSESKMYFAYFSGKIVERNQWHRKMEHELQEAEGEIIEEVREEFKEAIADTNEDFRKMKADLAFIKGRQEKIVKRLVKEGLKLEDCL